MKTVATVYWFLWLMVKRTDRDVCVASCGLCRVKWRSGHRSGTELSHVKQFPRHLQRVLVNVDFVISHKLASSYESRHNPSSQKKRARNSNPSIIRFLLNCKASLKRTQINLFLQHNVHVYITLPLSRWSFRPAWSFIDLLD